MAPVEVVEKDATLASADAGKPAAQASADDETVPGEDLPETDTAAASAPRGDGDKRPASATAPAKRPVSATARAPADDDDGVILDDDEDWEGDRSAAVPGGKGTSPQHPASGDGNASPNASPKRPVLQPGGRRPSAATLGQVYARVDSAQSLLQKGTSPGSPGMSHVEAAARMSAVKDLLRSEIQHLSQAVEQLDSMSVANYVVRAD